MVTCVCAGKIVFTPEGLPRRGFRWAKPKLKFTGMRVLAGVGEVPPSASPSRRAAAHSLLGTLPEAADEALPASPIPRKAAETLNT